MKRLLYIGFTIMSVLVLAACAGNSNDKGNEKVDNKTEETNQGNETTPTEDNGVTDETTTTQPADQEYMKEQMDKLDFMEFNLSVDYPDKREYEIEVEQEDNGDFEAELDDESNNKKLRGRQAFDEIYPFLVTLKVSKDTPREELINHVIEAFEIPDNYSKIEVEITFNDGTKVEHELLQE